jgi:hypothetical protein
MKIEFVNAEVLRVGPDEVLLVKFPPGLELTESEMDHLQSMLEEQLGDRFLVVGGDVELGVGRRGLRAP